MYDVSNNVSYKNLDYWKKYVSTNYGTINSIIIGNKTDLNTVLRSSNVLNSNRIISPPQKKTE